MGLIQNHSTTGDLKNDKGTKECIPAYFPLLIKDPRDGLKTAYKRAGKKIEINENDAYTDER